VAVVGHVNWQGRPAQPNASQQVPMTLTLKMGTLELDYNIESTDRSGFFTVTVAGMPSGTYAWRIKGAQYLANAGIVQLTSDRSEQPNPSRLLAANIEAGMLKAGDANNDNLVNVFDFGIMRNSFGKTIGIPGYDPRADFTGDGIVNIFDFNLVKQNFGAMGAPPI
jgi:hypothetical protein